MIYRSHKRPFILGVSMTTIVFNSLESALRWCKGHDVSTKYIDKLEGTWLMKYPGIHDPYKED